MVCQISHAALTCSRLAVVAGHVIQSWTLVKRKNDENFRRSLIQIAILERNNG